MCVALCRAGVHLCGDGDGADVDSFEPATKQKDFGGKYIKLTNNYWVLQCVCARMYVSLNVCMYACMYVRVHMYVRAHACVRVCM